MTSIIVFSKDRPMQLHAYLESLLLYSNTTPQSICVIYKESKVISYDLVKRSFSDVKWVEQKDFRADLEHCINEAADFVMFGCDDVVFTKCFSFGEIEDCLRKCRDVYGVSLRLGRNIKPVPHVRKKNKFLVWDWKSCKCTHYDYPFELDCTVYRKKDIQGLLSKLQDIVNPNQLEAEVAGNFSLYVNRPMLSCYDGLSKAIVITVNRVQNTCPNPVDGSSMTDTLTLFRLYCKGNHIDVAKVSKIPNRVIHVNSKYFILSGGNWDKNNSNMTKSISQIKHKLKVLMRLLNNVLSNLQYFVLHNLKHEILNDDNVYTAIDSILNHKYLNILTPMQTLERLENDQVGMVRFGDGELMLLEGKDIPFQQYDSVLAEKLFDILKAKDDRCMICIPHYYFYHDLEQLLPIQRRFLLEMGVKYRNEFVKYCSTDALYGDTGVTQLFEIYDYFEFDEFYGRIEKIISKYDVVCVCGEGTLNNFQYNLLEFAKTQAYIYCPRKNAFEQYDKILQKCLAVEKDKLILAALGPTAKVLVWDLVQNGYQAWDIGHLLKDYDMARRGDSRYEETLADFYRPD